VDAAGWQVPKLYGEPNNIANPAAPSVEPYFVFRLAVRNRSDSPPFSSMNSGPLLFAAGVRRSIPLATLMLARLARLSAAFFFQR
jgi:hypothetical protein